MRGLPLIVVVLAAGSVAARADEMDGWCAQVKKASSIVICSDPELRQQAAARNKLFETAREELSPEAYKALTDNQSRWIKSYTARCGISIDDPLPSLPIPQSVIDCYRRESLARTAFLAARLGEPSTAASPPANIAPNRNAALNAWSECLLDAADALSDQPEPARTVTDAAFGSCGKYEVDYERSLQDTLGQDFIEKLKAEAMVPKVLARVMADRAARAKLRKEAPSPSPAIDYNHM